MKSKLRGVMVSTPRASLVGHRVARMRNWLKRFDWPLFVGIALIAFVGLANLYSAVHDTTHSGKFGQQIKWMILGGGCFFLVASIEHHTIHRLSWLVFSGVILMLLAVYIMGDTSKGALRWLGLGGFRLQPSELAKIGIILAVARLHHDRCNGDLSIRWALALWVAICVPIVMVLMQPDLGTASLLVLIALSLTMTMSRKLMPAVLVIVALMLVGFFSFDKLHNYQQQRIFAFLDPSADPTGASWNAKQSIFAVGSGRLTGKGFLAATQNSFNFLPEYWTDFPFSVWAEEWGFLGAIFLLVLYGFVIFRCIHIALTARDRFGAAICVGVAAMIFWHMTVNISMVLGLVPVVGVTLPLISYGGSSVVTFWLGFGLVAGVACGR